MSLIFITGSADGLGHAAARNLLAKGHGVVVHVRNEARLEAVGRLLSRGAKVVIGDLSNFDQMVDVAHQVNRLGRLHAVIHNAGVYTGRQILPVNVVAPYVLTTLVSKPSRLVYLSSGMHLRGRPSLEGLDWTGHRISATYSDSKLFVTTLAAAVARMWPDVVSSAVDPGWVPTKMGGSNAPDDLRLGHLTQEWLVTSDDPAAGVSGAYWYHQHRREPHAASQNAMFQAELLNELKRATGVTFPEQT